MPHNKPEKIHNQQNKDSIREESIAVRPDKAYQKSTKPERYSKAGVLG